MLSVRRLLLALGALSALIASPAVHAQKGAPLLGPTYTVSLLGLPAGLQLTLHTAAVFCSLSPQRGPEVNVPMVEQSFRRIVRIDLPGGPLFKAVVDTVYTAQTRPVLSADFPEPLCGGVSITPTGNNVLFEASVAGVAASGSLEARKVSLPGARLDTGPFTQSLTIALRVAAPTFGGTAIGSLRQGQLGTMTARFDGLFFQHTRPSMAFTVPAAKGSLLALPTTLARLSLSSTGRSCISAAGRTVCVGDVPKGPSGLTELGGVGLKLVRAFSSSADYSFMLTSAFPIGTVTMQHTQVLDDDWLPLVQGVPTYQQLGSIEPSTRSISILAPQ